ncbi:hypothetical protein [Pseudomonas sp. LF090]
MTDYTELKRLAEAAPEGPWFGPEYAPGTSYVFDVDLGTLLHYESIDTEQDACLRYVAAANPAAVLALIAQLEQDEMHLRVFSRVAETAVSERDQLKAENARSTEREILQLAEIEALRKGLAGMLDMHLVAGRAAMGKGDRGGQSAQKMSESTDPEGSKGGGL